MALSKEPSKPQTPVSTCEFLKSKVNLFKGFTDSQLQELVDGSQLMSFEVNEAVAHCGDAATHFHVITSGTLAASILGEGGVRRVLGQLQEGATFGELALMTGDTLLADFIAETPSQVLRIPVSLFQSKIMTQPEAARHVSRTIAERFKEVAADPSKAAAALRQSEDPYGLKLKSDRPEKILVINCGSSSVKYSF